MEQPLHSLYARLMARHNKDLMSYIYTLHPNTVEAEDIHQELAIKIYKNFEKYDSDRPFLPWAFKFASFEVLSFRRNKARSKLIFSEELLQTMTEERPLYESELTHKRAKLGNCVKKLKSEDQRLLHWRYHSEKTIKQMAELLGIPAKKLYKRLERLRLALYQCIQHS